MYNCQFNMMNFICKLYRSQKRKKKKRKLASMFQVFKYIFLIFIIHIEKVNAINWKIFCKNYVNGTELFDEMLAFRQIFQPKQLKHKLKYLII